MILCRGRSDQRWWDRPVTTDDLSLSVHLVVQWYWWERAWGEEVVTCSLLFITVCYTCRGCLFILQWRPVWWESVSATACSVVWGYNWNSLFYTTTWERGHAGHSDCYSLPFHDTVLRMMRRIIILLLFWFLKEEVVFIEVLWSYTTVLKGYIVQYSGMMTTLRVRKACWAEMLLTTRLPILCAKTLPSFWRRDAGDWSADHYVTGSTCLLRNDLYIKESGRGEVEREVYFCSFCSGSDHSVFVYTFIVGLMPCMWWDCCSGKVMIYSWEDWCYISTVHCYGNAIGFVIMDVRAIHSVIDLEKYLCRWWFWKCRWERLCWEVVVDGRDECFLYTTLMPFHSSVASSYYSTTIRYAYTILNSLQTICRYAACWYCWFILLLICIVGGDVSLLYGSTVVGIWWKPCCIVEDRWWWWWWHSCLWEDDACCCYYRVLCGHRVVGEVFWWLFCGGSLATIEDDNILWLNTIPLNPSGGRFSYCGFYDMLLPMTYTFSEAMAELWKWGHWNSERPAMRAIYHDEKDTMKQWRKYEAEEKTQRREIPWLLCNTM